MYLTVVIPSYNEEKNIKAGALKKVADFFSRQSYEWEVLVVDDGSIDESARLVEQFVANKPRFRLIKNPHRGKAFTVRTGVLEAKGQYVLFTDMDQATPPEEIEKLLPFLDRRGYDIAIGSREIMGAKREDEPFHRHLMGKGFNFVVQLLAISNIHDTQCGFKLFRNNVAKDLFKRMQVYRDLNQEVKGPLVTAFDVELLFLAKKRGLKIAEVPVFWHHVKSQRVNPLKDSYRMFMDVLKIRLNDVRGVYGKASKD